MKTPIYIGRFTPVGGGITGKNKAIFDSLVAETAVKQIDLTLIKRGSINTLFKLVSALLSRNSTLIIGTAAKMRRAFSRWLHLFNRRTMNNSLLIVMGGQFGNIIAVDRAYQKWVKQYKMLYVETQGMKKTLNSVGVNNVSVFPNCRVRPSADIAVRPRSKTLKCVCFSMIYPEKGIDIALEAATRLPKVSFDFWGPVREDYRNEFLSAVDRLSNCTYNGVFQVDGDNVYSVLNQYDLLLFPTRLTGEGVPGTLIEAKIAALPTVVSNVAYNAELVKDGVNGIVLKENNSVCLADVIESMDADDAALMRIKQGALDSGSAYYFDEYITNLLAELGVKS